MSNVLIRILTALLGVPLVVGLTYLGGWYFGVLVLLVALVGQWEVYQLMGRGGMAPLKGVGLVLGGLLGLSPLFPATLPLAIGGILLVLAASPFLAPDPPPFQRLGSTVLGLLYPTGLLIALTHLRLARGPTVGDQEAFYLTLSVFVLIWITDTLAYVVGRTVGAHALAPRISPKKTWEGTLGGAIGAVLAAVALKLSVLGFLAWVHVLMLALVCGVIGQLGDLAESGMKRSVDAKDSGALLPGHGGVLDRFDAMILAAPCVTLYLKYLARIIA